MRTAFSLREAGVRPLSEKRGLHLVPSTRLGSRLSAFRRYSERAFATKRSLLSPGSRTVRRWRGRRTLLRLSGCLKTTGSGTKTRAAFRGRRLPKKTRLPRKRKESRLPHQRWRIEAFLSLW